MKGDIYEGLLAKSAAESPKGAGQYFTPRATHQGHRRLRAADRRRHRLRSGCRHRRLPAGRLRLSSSSTRARRSTRTRRSTCARSSSKGWEIVPNTARLCIMNLYLHGIDADPCPIKSGVDSLASDPGERFSLVLTNPPFGKKSSIAIVNEAGDLEKEDESYERQDFWTTTKNKQLNFLQHVKTLLKINGRCAIVVPDNVLFEGGAGENGSPQLCSSSATCIRCCGCRPESSTPRA